MKIRKMLKNIYVYIRKKLNEILSKNEPFHFDHYSLNKWSFFWLSMCELEPFLTSQRHKQPIIELLTNTNPIEHVFYKIVVQYIQFSRFDLHVNLLHVFLACFRFFNICNLRRNKGEKTKLFVQTTTKNRNHILFKIPSSF